MGAPQAHVKLRIRAAPAKQSSFAFAVDDGFSGLPKTRVTGPAEG